MAARKKFPSRQLAAIFVPFFFFKTSIASVSYKGLYVVDHERIGKPDCQQNLVRAWAEALHGPLASYAGNVLDINTPHRVYGTALNWSVHDSGHELGQIKTAVARRVEGGVIADGRLEIQPVACLDRDCKQATLVLLHNRDSLQLPLPLLLHADCHTLPAFARPCSRLPC